MMTTSEQPRGYLCLVLHAHLPFVRHVDAKHRLEEVWLHEAITDTYLPLLDVMNGWVRDGVPFALAMSVTPPLAAMLADPLLQERYVLHLERSIALSERQMHQNAHDPRIAHLAAMYRARFLHAKESFTGTYGCDILGALRRLTPHGLELMASAATHGFLPLMEPVTSAVRAQIRAGVEQHRAVFGEQPVGFWLPECGFFPGHDGYLVEEGIRYTIGDTHALMHGTPRPRYAVYAPVYTPAGLAVFGRDVESSKQVWSASEGYPGDYDYREFYRDAGYDLPWEEVAPYLPCGVRSDTGLKYYRITGPGDHKEVYDPERAAWKVRTHADNFVFNRIHQMRYIAEHMDRAPVILSPYDAELFGHWWFEGPAFLDGVMRALSNQKELVATTPGRFLKRYATHQVVDVSQSTWGYKGYSEVWLEGANDWVYRHLHEAGRTMENLAGTFGAEDPEPLTRRALNQAARELFLAQSSDWAFIMKTGTVVEYAVRRTQDHLHNFYELAHAVRTGEIDAHKVAALEHTHNLLPHVDFRMFLPSEGVRPWSASLTRELAPMATASPASR